MLINNSILASSFRVILLSVLVGGVSCEDSAPDSKAGEERVQAGQGDEVNPSSGKRQSSVSDRIVREDGRVSFERLRFEVESPTAGSSRPSEEFYDFLRRATPLEVVEFADSVETISSSHLRAIFLGKPGFFDRDPSLFSRLAELDDDPASKRFIDTFLEDTVWLKPENIGSILADHPWVKDQDLPSIIRERISDLPEQDRHAEMSSYLVKLEDSPIYPEMVSLYIQEAPSTDLAELGAWGLEQTDRIVGMDRALVTRFESEDSRHLTDKYISELISLDRSDRANEAIYSVLGRSQIDHSAFLEKHKDWLLKSGGWEDAIGRAFLWIHAKDPQIARAYVSSLPDSPAKADLNRRLEALQKED